MLVRRNLAAVLADLPPFSAARNPSDGAAILIKRGERGYHPADGISDPEAFNASRGITPAQAEAMLTGSMFGFDVPGADPLNCVLHTTPSDKMAQS